MNAAISLLALSISLTGCNSEIKKAKKAIETSQYELAEQILQDHIKDSPDDVAALVLLGDTQTLIAKKAGKDVLVPLQKAFASYAGALHNEPSNCVAWNRLGTLLFTVTSSIITDRTGNIKNTLSFLNELPLDKATDPCSSTAVESIRLFKDASQQQEQHILWGYLPLSGYSLNDLTWESIPHPTDPPEVEQRFIFIKDGIVASGIGGVPDRTIKKGEVFSIEKIDGTNLVFFDQENPNVVDATGWVEVGLCGGIRLNVNIEDLTCSPGPWQENKFTGKAIYDPTQFTLKDGMYVSSLDKEYSFKHYLGDSVVCKGGAPGPRIAGGEPVCDVTFKKAVEAHRSVPAEDVIILSGGPSGRDDERRIKWILEHTDPNLTTAATAVINNQVAKGMPLPVFWLSLGWLGQCNPRGGILQAVELSDDATKLNCESKDIYFKFADLELTEWSIPSTTTVP